VRTVCRMAGALRAGAVLRGSRAAVLAGVALAVVAYQRGIVEAELESKGLQLVQLEVR
jgi:hypothetical protein